jgi:hypothetical protein
LGLPFPPPKPPPESKPVEKCAQPEKCAERPSGPISRLITPPAGAARYMNGCSIVTIEPSDCTGAITV